MMKIEIFGMGCPSCSKLEVNTQAALKETGTDAEVIKIDNIDAIAARGIMGVPAIAVDGELKSSGKLLSVKQIKKLLSANS